LFVHNYSEKVRFRIFSAGLSTSEIQTFYEAIKAVYGPTHHSFHPVQSKHCNTLIKDHEGILSRRAEHLSELLNHINPTDPTFVDQLPQLPPLPDLDTTPSFHEVTEAVKGLKNDTAARHDGIPAEILKTVVTAYFIDFDDSLSVHGPLIRYLNNGKTLT